MSRTGLGPGTVALSLEVFIAVMFFAHERLGSCLAERIQSLPEALKMNRDQMIEHFCSAGCASEPQLSCGSNARPQPVCSQICNSDSCNDKCWILPESPSRCYANQDRICSYSNANVCQSRYGNRTSTCMYASSSPAFCICQYTPNTPYIRCEPSKFIGPPIRIPGVQDITTPATVAQNIEVYATTVQATTALATTAQATTAHVTTSAQDTTAQYTTAQVTTTALDTTAQYTTAQVTTTAQDSTAQHTTAQVIAAQDTAAQDAGAQPTVPQETTAHGITAHVTTTNQPDDNETNVAAIVLGCLFALLLLLVTIRAVILRLRRQGRLPSFMKQTTKPTELSSVKFKANLSINRRQLPEPPTPDGNVEYAYIPYVPTANPRLENEAYASAQEEEGGSHDVKTGREYEETIDAIKNTYFGRIQTTERKTESEASETAESQVVSSATGDVPREDNNISFPLTQHMVRKTSEDGYEIPMVKPITANH